MASYIISENVSINKIWYYADTSRTKARNAGSLTIKLVSRENVCTNKKVCSQLKLCIDDLLMEYLQSKRQD